MCLPVVAGVLAGVGSAMSALQSRANSKAQAGFERRQSALERESGSFEAARKQDQLKRVVGQQRAAFAANGLALAGSATDVIDDSATEGALDIASIRWGSKLRSDNLNYKAKISDMNARAAGLAAPVAFLTPVIGGVAKYASSFE